MLYEEYKAKLTRRRQLFERLWKYRLLIFAAVVLLIAVSCVLLSIKGTVYDFYMPETLQYGQDISASADCLLGEAAFEYRAVGERQWTTQRPLYAGKYECRPIGKTAAGSWRAGQIKTFEIAPIEVEVTVYGSDLIYGDEIVFYAELFYGDKLQVKNYTITDENGNLFVSFDAKDVVAYNAEGRDVTFSYVFSAKDKAIALKQRPVTIDMPSATAEYDGKPHSFNEASADEGLLSGHRVEVTADSFTEAGSYGNAAESYRILDADGKDVTSMYDVTCVPGKVDILPRRITVGATPSAIVYDGKAHVYDECELLDGTSLADGHSLALSDFCERKDAGEYDNSTKVAVFDGDRDVTGNYEITRRFEKMVILPLPVTVATSDETVDYTGVEQTFGSVSLAENFKVIDGHHLMVTAPTAVRNAGEYINAPTFEICDEDGKNVTDNYDITYRYGKITVNRCAVTLTTTSYDRWYSGDPNVPDGAEGAIENCGSLLKDGDRFTVRYVNETMTDAKEDGYDNAPEIDIVGADGKSALDNYILTVNRGKITVKKRKLNVSVAEYMRSLTYVYNGKEQGPIEIGVDVVPSSDDNEGYGLVKGQTIVAHNAAMLKNANNTALYNLSFKIAADNKSDNLADNYDITLTQNGGFKIEPKHITVRTASGSKKYDGEPFILSTATVEGLVDGHDYKLENIVCVYTTIDVGVCSNAFNFDLVITDGTEDVTANYYVKNVFYGYLAVLKRDVTLTTGGDNIVYDAQPHNVAEDKISVSGSGLVKGHTVIADFDSFVDAGEYKNIPNKFKQIVDADGEDKTDNYNISWNYGTIVIERRPITVQTASAGEEKKIYYDGYAHSATTFNVTGEPYPLADGQKLIVTFGSYTEAGSYPNDPTSFEIVGDDESYASHEAVNYNNNYVVTWQSGQVVISQRPITVRTGNATQIYDGESHGANSSELVLSDEQLRLVDGQSLEISYRSWLHASEIPYENIPLDFKIIANDARSRTSIDISKNYEISWIYGAVIISKRNITVTPVSESFTYNATAHSYGNGNLLQIGGDGLAPGEAIRVLNEQDCSFTYVGEYTYTPQIEIYKMADGSSVPESDYDIKLTGGVITVNKCPLSVTTTSKEVFYSAEPNVPLGVEDAIVNWNSLLPGADRFTVRYGDEKMINYTENGYLNAPIIDIVNEKGISVKNNYDGLSEVTYGRIVVKKRTLRYRVVNRTYEYNGQLQGKGSVSYIGNNDDYDIYGNGLIPGQTVSAENKAQLKDCGSVPLDVEFAIQARDGSLATGNYNIIIDQNGVLTITPKNITVRTSDASRKYNGQPLTCGDIEVSGLVSGHRFVHSVTSDLPSQTVKGTTENSFSFTLNIYDGQEDVTRNYKQTAISYGTLKVTELQLELTTGNGTFVYDGQPHSVGSDRISISGDKLIVGHYIETSFKSYTDAGTYDNTCGKIRVKDANGDDVTVNYTIAKVTPGKVSITPRKITIATGSSKSDIEYDGEKHSVIDELAVQSETTFVTGHKIVAAEPYKSFYAEFEDAGKHANKPIDGAWKIVDESGNEILQSNYNISWKCGTVTITRRAVTIQLGSDEIVYDAQLHRVNEFSIISLKQLVEGQELTIVCKAFTSVAVSRNRLESDDSYTITRKSDGSVVSHANYKFTWVDGTVRIVRRPLTIQVTEDFTRSWTYDGTCHLKDGEISGLEGITVVYDDDYPRILNHLVFIECEKPTEAGNYKFKFSVKIKVNGTEDVSSNYDIVDRTTNIQITILQRPVKITAHDNTWVYEAGTTFSEEGYDADGMLLGHVISRLTATKIGSITDHDGKVGYVNNEFRNIKIANANGKDVTNNYAITAIPGKLRVKSPIEVYVYSIRKTYDGQEILLSRDSSYKIKTLPPDVSESDVTVNLRGSLTKPGTLTLEQVKNQSDCSVNPDKGVNRIDFIGQQNVVEIIKQKITIRSATVVSADRSKPLYGSDYAYSVIGELVDGDSLQVTITGILQTDDERAANTIDRLSIVITDKYGNNVTDCYEIEIDEGTLSWTTG